MIIRSQDKIKLVIFDNVKKIYVKEPYGLTRVMDTATGEFNEEFKYEVYADDIKLGVYKSEGRAIQVLDEIEKLYESCNMMQAGNEAGNAILLSSGNPYVYQVPKD